jgi:hypothetical protein
MKKIIGIISVVGIIAIVLYVKSFSFSPILRLSKTVHIQSNLILALSIALVLISAFAVYFLIGFMKSNKGGKR